MAHYSWIVLSQAHQTAYEESLDAVSRGRRLRLRHYRLERWQPLTLPVCLVLFAASAPLWYPANLAMVGLIGLVIGFASSSIGKLLHQRWNAKSWAAFEHSLGDRTFGQHLAFVNAVEEIEDRNRTAGARQLVTSPPVVLCPEQDRTLNALLGISTDERTAVIEGCKRMAPRLDAFELRRRFGESGYQVAQQVLFRADHERWKNRQQGF